MKKKLLAILLTVCMVLSMAPAALAADSVFTDVNAGDWFAEEVEYVYDNGLMNGIGNNKFDPNGNVTRAMVWTTLARLDGEDTAGSDPWWLAGQKWAMENGISDGTMATENITREQLVTMIWRYAKYIDMDVSEGEDTNILSYTDALDVNEWAISAMQWACAVGIIKGIDGALQPQGDASRAMLAAILYRFVEEVMPEEEEPVTPSIPSYPSYPIIPTPPSPTPAHGEHTYTYTPNNDGTHDATCTNSTGVCSAPTIDDEACTIGDDGVCEYCGYIAYIIVTDETHIESIIQRVPDGTVIHLTAGVDYGEVGIGGGYSVTDLPDNITIVGAPGARMGMEIVNGFNVNGWTFQNVTFGGDGFRTTNGASADNLTFQGCVFGEGTYLYIMRTDGGYGKDVTITGCEFSDNIESAIIIQNAEDVTISGCTFENAGRNAIQLTAMTGEIVVSGNTINGTTDRPLRFNNTSATITVTGNTITSNGDSAGQVMKVDGTVDTTKITLDNTWNGYDDEELGYNNGVWSLPSA